MLQNWGVDRLVSLFVVINVWNLFVKKSFALTGKFLYIANIRQIGGHWYIPRQGHCLSRETFVQIFGIPENPRLLVAPAFVSAGGDT